MNIEWSFHPTLRDPHALVAFEGWGDASNASSSAAEFLIQDLDRPFATVQPDLFFNFQMQRPVVQIDRGGTRQVHWPGTDFFSLQDEHAGRDLIIALGEEPHLRWRAFAAEFIDVFERLGVDLVVTMGAFIGRVAHTLPVPIIGVATDPEMLGRYDLLASDYQGPTGIVGALHDELRQAGIASVSLWAPIPHYLAANPNPKAAHALLSKVMDITGISLDLSSLADEVADFERRVDDAMEQSDELISYIKKLETEGTDPVLDQGDADQLISEIEQFLQDT